MDLKPMISEQGDGPNGKFNEVLLPAKAVSSGMGDLDLIEHEILAVEAETSNLEKKREMPKSLLNAQQERKKVRIEVIELERAAKWLGMVPGERGRNQEVSGRLPGRGILFGVCAPRCLQD